MNLTMRKVLKVTNYVVVTLVATVLSLVLALLLLLGTERGTQITLHAVNHSTDAELTWEDLDGHLLRKVQFGSIRYEDDEVLITADNLVFNWRPWRLLGRLLHVRDLKFDALSVHLPSTEDEPADGDTSVQLPEVDLPINIRLDRIDLNAIDLRMGDFEQHIDEVKLRLYSRGARHDINRFSVRTPQGEASLAGHIITLGDYEFDLYFNAQTELEDLGDLHVGGRLAGTTADLHTQVSIRGLAQADLEAQLQNTLDLDSLSWQLEGHLQALNIEAAAEHIHEVDIRVHGEGGLEQATLTIDGEIDTVAQGLVTLDTKFSYADMRIDIQRMIADIESNQAEAEVTGFAEFGEQLLVDIEGSASYLGFDLASFEFFMRGDTDGASELKLTADVLTQGSLDLEGSIYWQPYLRWDLDLRLDNIDIDELHEDVSGNLALHALTSGQLDDTLRLSLQLRELSGSLREQDIQGRGQLEIDDQHFTADDFHLQWGHNQLSADGTYSPEGLSLNWNLSIPQISDIYADAAGTIESTGELSGSQESPYIQTRTRASELAFQHYRVASVDADVSVDGSLARLPTGELRVQGIEVDQLAIETLDLTLSQNEQHRTQLRLVSDELRARLDLRGQWELDDWRWHGQIHTLELRYPEVGRWNLSNPVDLDASPSHVNLSGLCLLISTRESQICANAQWTQETGDIVADIAAEDVPYQLFTPWLPDDIELLGEFSLLADIRQQDDALDADVRLNITDTTVRIPAQDLSIDFESGELLRIQGNQERLNAQLRLLSEQLDGGIEAQAEITDVLTDNATIEGFLGVDIQDLAIVSVVTPELQNVTGHLSGRVDYSGALLNPTVSGGLELREGFAEIPATGLELRNLNLTILAPEDNQAPFTLQGDVDAGEGSLNIAGEYFLQEQRARLHVEGDTFPALNTRELQVRVAPNLDIEYSPAGLRLRGSVDVPYARITPPDFESVDSISRDTVLVHGEGSIYDETLTELPIHMDVRVNLGDDVRVSAYGFEGRLTGGLRIIEEPGQETSAVGNIDVASGEYEIYGQRLQIERGRLIFTGGPVVNPGLDLRVERRIEMDSVTVGARVGGTLENPTLNLFSTPTMQDSAILSYLIFGRGPGQGTSGEENMLARASLALGMTGGNRLGERLSDTLGVDEVSLDSGDTFESTALYIGKQISSRLYIKYGVGLVEPVSTFFIQYRLNRHLNFESQTSNEHSGADFFYTIER